MKDPKASLRYMYSQYKKSARKRGLTFAVSTEEFERLVGQNCVYCGTGPLKPYTNFNKYPSIPLYATGLDRVDNTKGYVLGNVRPCCFVCNRAKMDMSYEDFIMWIKHLIHWSPYAA